MDNNTKSLGISVDFKILSSLFFPKSTHLFIGVIFLYILEVSSKSLNLFSSPSI